LVEKNIFLIQNFLFRAAPYYDYSDAIQRWYIEINNPWCACSTGYKHCCGHYIQVNNY